MTRDCLTVIAAVGHALLCVWAWPDVVAWIETKPAIYAGN